MMEVLGLVLLVLAVAIVQAEEGSCGSKSKNPEAQLISELLADYDTNARPVLDPTQSLAVTMSISLLNIDDYDHDREELTLSVYPQIFWKDEFLEWEPEDHSGIKQLHINADRLWIPDVMLYSTLRDGVELDRTPAVVKSDGSGIWVPISTIRVPCQMEDNGNINCTIMYGSWTYHEDEINLQLAAESADLSFYRPNKKFELVSAIGKRNAKTYDCCPEKYIDITYSLILKPTKKAKK